MRSDRTRQVAAHELAQARRAADQLRAIVSLAPSESDTLVLKTADADYTFTKGELSSIAKIVASVAGTETDAEISPQDAAMLLSMSRPSVMRLIEKGHLGARMVNTHYRLSQNEVVAYRERQAKIRRQGLSELTRIADEYDF